MITDDQVVALLRDAGNAGPMPAPLAAGDAVARARRDRTRFGGLVGIAAAVVAVGLVASADLPAPVRAAGGDGVGGTPDPGPTLFVLAGAALAVVLAAIATPLALRLGERSHVRAVLAATWGAFALAVGSLTMYPTASLLVSPSRLVDGVPRNWALLAGSWESVVLLLMVLALLARRRLRPGSLRPFCGALWLVAALHLGYWFAAVLYLQILDRVGSRYGAAASFDRYSLVALALVIVAALGLGMLALRGQPHARSRVLGGTVVVASAGAAGVWASTLYSFAVSVTTTEAARWFVLSALVLSLGAAALGAMVALPPAPRRLTTALVAALAASASTTAGSGTTTALQTTARIGHEASAFGGMVASVLVALVAVALVALLDRRTRMAGPPSAGELDLAATSTGGGA